MARKNKPITIPGRSMLKGRELERTPITIPGRSMLDGRELKRQKVKETKEAKPAKPAKPSWLQRRRENQAAKKEEEKRRKEVVEVQSGAIIDAYSQGLITNDELNGILDWVFNGGELPASLQPQTEEAATVASVTMLTDSNRLARSLELAVANGMENAILAETAGSELITDSDVTAEDGRTINEIMEERRKNNETVKQEEANAREKLQKNRESLKELTDLILDQLSKNSVEARQYVMDLFVSAKLGGEGDETYVDGKPSNIPVDAMIQWTQGGMLAPKQRQTIEEIRQKALTQEGRLRKKNPPSPEQLKQIYEIREKVPAEMRGMFDEYVGFSVTTQTTTPESGVPETTYSATDLTDEQRKTANKTRKIIIGLSSAVRGKVVQGKLTETVTSVDLGITQATLDGLVALIKTDDQLEQERQELINAAREGMRIVPFEKLNKDLQRAMTERQYYLQKLINDHGKKKVGTKVQAEIRQKAIDRVATRIETEIGNRLNVKYKEIEADVRALYDIDIPNTEEEQRKLQAELGLDDAQFAYYKQIKIEAGKGKTKEKPEVKFNYAKHYSNELAQLTKLEEGIIYSQEQLLSIVTNENGQQIPLDKLTNEQREQLTAAIGLREIYKNQRDIVTSTIAAKEEIRRIGKLLVDCKYETLVSIQQEKEDKLKEIDKKEAEYKREFPEFQGLSSNSTPEAKQAKVAAINAVKSRIQTEKNAVYDIMREKYSKAISKDKQIIADAQREAYFAIYKQQLMDDGVSAKEAQKVVDKLKSKHKKIKTEELEATLKTDYVAGLTGPEQTKALLKINSSIERGYNAAVDEQIKTTVPEGYPQTLDGMQKRIASEKTARDTLGTASESAESLAEIVDGPITIEVVNSKGKKEKITFNSREELENYYSEKTKKAETAAAYLSGGADTARERVETDSQKAMDYARKQHLKKRYEVVTSFIEDLNKLAKMCTTSQGKLEEISEETRKLLQEQGIDVSAIISGTQTDIRNTLNDCQDVRDQIIQEAMQAGLVPVYGTQKTTTKPVAEGEPSVEEVVATDELTRFVSQADIEAEKEGLYPIIKDGKTIGYTTTPTKASSTSVATIRENEKKRAEEAARSASATRRSGGESEVHEVKKPGDGTGFVADETEVKKDETEVKKDETEVKKDETEVKKDETEVKKDETEVKKDETEVKKDETEHTEKPEDQVYDEISRGIIAIQYLGSNSHRTPEEKEEQARSILGENYDKLIASGKKAEEVFNVALQTASGRVIELTQDLQDDPDMTIDKYVAGMTEASKRELERRKEAATRHEDKPLEEGEEIVAEDVVDAARGFYNIAERETQAKMDEIEALANKYCKATKITKYGAARAIKELGKVQGAAAQAAVEDALNAQAAATATPSDRVMS